MEYDVKKLMDAKYVNDLISNCQTKINDIKVKFVSFYTLESIKELGIENVVSLFSKYEVSCENILNHFLNDYIDDNWAYADLYTDDVLFAKEMKKIVNEKAENEVNQLNNKIDKENKELQKEIDTLEKEIQIISKFVRLNDESVIPSEEEIDDIKQIILNSDISMDEKLSFSYNLVRYIVNRKKSLAVTTSFELDSFEQELTKIYSDVTKDEENINEDIYSQTIVGYYHFYKDLFKDAQLGDTLYEVMEFSCDLAKGVNTSIDSILKEQFCVEMAALFYALNKECKNKENKNNKIVENILQDLAILDKIYEQDDKLREYKNSTIDEVDDDLAMLSMLFVSSSYNDRITGKLLNLKAELKNNLITEKRKKAIVADYCNVKLEIKKIVNDNKLMDRIVNLNSMVSNLLVRGSSRSVDFKEDTYYIGLTNLKGKLAELLSKIKKNVFIPNLSDELDKLEEEFEKYVEKEEKLEYPIKGFVFFDFDEETQPYVINDLDPHSKKNFIDDAIESNKINSAFEQYSLLIKELLTVGQPVVFSEDSNVTYQYRMLDFVYYDVDTRKRPTKMVRIRPLRNSLVRFVGRNIVLSPNTKIYNQVIDIFHEILPNISIDKKQEFSLYINFASSLKKSSVDVYGQAINRYDRLSPIHRVMISMVENDELSDMECEILKESIKISLNAYSELEKRNDQINFNLNTVIGGRKTYG